MFLLRGLPVLIEVGLLVYCLIEVIQTPSAECRNLAKGYWLGLIVVLPLVGSIAWLVAGRPKSRLAEHERPAQHRVVAPDDDPEFLANLRNIDREQEELLRRWEEDLRDRDATPRSEDDDPRKEPGAP